MNEPVRVPGLPQILDALRDVIDPEVGHNIVDLGLIYGIGVDEDVLWLNLTMTTPGCPAQDYIRAGVRQRGLQIPGIRDVDIELVWSPPWTVHKIAPRVRAELGLQDTAA